MSLDSCTCKECKVMCSHPCWPTPDEAVALINAGFSGKLMADFWVNTDRPDTDILCPAVPGYENEYAPQWIGFSPKDSGCVFQSDDGLCKLHDMGLKPIEGRLAMGCADDDENNNTHRHVFEMWDNEDAQKLVNDWRQS